MNSQISHSPSGNVPYNEFCNDFLRELHCIGSLPSVLHRFAELSGWTLTYHCVDSVPAFLQASCGKENTVSLTPSAECVLPTPLPPELLEEIAEEENLWIPIEIKSEFLRKNRKFASHSEDISDVSPEMKAVPGQNPEKSLSEECGSSHGGSGDCSEKKNYINGRKEGEKRKEGKEEAGVPSLPPVLSFLNRPVGFLHLKRSVSGKNAPENSLPETHPHVPAESHTAAEPRVPAESHTAAESHTSEESRVSSVSHELHKSLFQKNLQNEKISCLTFEEAARCAASLGDLLAEMQALRVHLWFSEMDAAASMAIQTERPNFQNEVFALRFRKLLEYAASVLQMDAIGIYLLENGSQSLKLRASVGLSMDSLMNPVRTLGKAQADLHAIHDGNIFVYDTECAQESAELLPENFQAGVCMPLATDRSTLGTVWFYSNRLAHVSDRTIQEAELMSEHFAIYLEREAFFRRYDRSLEYSSDLEAAASLQKIQAPICLPGHCKPDLSGWCRSPRTVRNPIRKNPDVPSALDGEKSVSGDFYDWFTLPSGRTLIALGDVGVPGLGGAILAASVRSALRSHAQYEQSVTDILQNVHKTLWLQMAADAKISLFCAVVSHEGPFLTVHHAHSGILRALHIQKNSLFQAVPLSDSSAENFLARHADFHCHEDILYLDEGESLVVFNDGLSHGSDFSRPQGISGTGCGRKNVWGAAQIQTRREMERMLVNCNLGRILSDKKQPTARLLMSLVRNYFQNKVLMDRNADQSVLVIRHQ